VNLRAERIRDKDTRVEAVGTVSMVTIGQMVRNGFTGDVKSADVMPLLMMGCNARASDASAAEIATVTERSLWQIIPHDAFTNADVFLTQPLLMVARSDVGS
jgi:hypothetical protein